MRWLLLALITLQSATCGQKGPLMLPDAEPSQATAVPAQLGGGWPMGAR